MSGFFDRNGDKRSSVLEDLDMPIDDIALCEFLIQKQNGKKLTLKWSKFRNLSVKTLIRINNIDLDYTIVIKPKV